MASDPKNVPSSPLKTIGTPRLTLRPFSALLKPSIKGHKSLDEHYLQFFYRMRRQPRVMQWSLEGTIDSSLAQTESWVLARVKRRWTFVVERKLNLSNTTDPPEPIGSLAIRLPVESEKAPDFQVSYPELGFMLDETFHGEGYATEAVRALLESFWAETKGWDVVEAYVGPANQGSLRVIAKCGFEYWTEDGEDHVYRLTRPKK